MYDDFLKIKKNGRKQKIIHKYTLSIGLFGIILCHFLNIISRSFLLFPYYNKKINFMPVLWIRLFPLHKTAISLAEMAVIN